VYLAVSSVAAAAEETAMALVVKLQNDLNKKPMTFNATRNVFQLLARPSDGA
jgi:hypothetical protein